MSTRNDDAGRLARRAAIRDRLLTSQGLPLDVAERWCDAWEAEATLRGLTRDDAAYWDAGKLWIDRQCAVGKRPPN